MLTEYNYSSLSSFEERIKHLEERVRYHDRVLQQRDHHIPLSSRPADSPSRVAWNQRGDGQSQIWLDESSIQELPPEETVTDGMAVAWVDEEDSAFFGPSSNIAFMRHILRIMSLPRNTAAPPAPSAIHGLDYLDSGILNTSRAPSPATKLGFYHDGIEGLDPSVVQLPSVERIEGLLESYFNNTGLLFPFVHRETFMTTYRQMQQTRFAKVRRTWLGLLYIILAMAISTTQDRPADERMKESTVFYERASYICRSQMVRGTSLEIGNTKPHRNDRLICLR